MDPDQSVSADSNSNVNLSPVTNLNTRFIVTRNVNGNYEFLITNLEGINNNFLGLTNGNSSNNTNVVHNRNFSFEERKWIIEDMNPEPTTPSGLKVLLEVGEDV